jgi:hypothetical protein
MKTTSCSAVAAAMMVALWAGNDGLRAQGPSRVSAALEPSNEVPAVSSPASGTFTAQIDDAGQAIDYELTYSGLQAPVLMAHIHMAQPNVNGGIVVWLCGTAAMPGPSGTQTCPESGTITGTIKPEHVQTVTTQGIATNELDEVIDAIRAGLAYVNVHSTQSTGGEIRGQLRPGNGPK